MAYKDPEYQKNYRESHRKHYRILKWLWRKSHKEHLKEYNKKYRLKHLEQCREATKKWEEMHYKQKREKAEIWAKNHPDKIKVTHEKQNAKHRKLGVISLNEPFAGSVGHHIDKQHIIHIPKELHCSVWHNIWTGHNMTEINGKTFEWLNNHKEVE